ncbi:AAA family ATPase [Nocardia sp. NPDC055321]
MRLHRLELTAFGPFADTAVVDFDELGADGLFLLHGQTGAGKTTVLDAIAFALYGSVPGARGEIKQLHSDHADKQVAPQVRLEATLGGRRLRLVRKAGYMRPSKRAKTGVTEEKPSATLEWLDGRGQNLSRIPDIGDEVLRLLGMSADQFFQVVLLPQGDFARFLRAENEEREKLLEKLFDTERFGAAEKWLTDKRRESTADLDTRKQAIDRLIASVGTAAGLPTTATAGPLESVGWSQSLLGAARIELTAATTELRAQQGHSAATRRAAEAQRGLHELHRRRAEALTRLEEHAAGADRREASQLELDRARRAEPVAAALAEARAAAVALRRREDEATRTAEQLADRLLEPASAELPGTRWAAQDLAAGELTGSDLAVELEGMEEPTTDAGAPHEFAGGAGAASGPAEAADESMADGSDAGAAAGDAAGARDGLGAQRAADPGVSGGAGGTVATSGAPGSGAAESRDGLDANRTGGYGPDGTGVPGAPGHSAGVTAEVSAMPGPSMSAAQSRRSGLEAAVQRWSGQMGALDEVRADAESAHRLNAELARLREEQRVLGERTATVERKRGALPERLVRVQGELREATDAAAGLPVLEAERERWKNAARAALELDRRRAELDSARADFEARRGAHLDARERTLALREQRLAGMAAELAADLVDGEACSVCGSAEHPAPARPAAHAVSKEAEEAALAAERAAEAARDRVGQSITELERAVEVLVERGGDTDKAELAAALSAAETGWAASRALAGEAAALTTEFERLRAEEVRLQDELRDCESRASATMERLVAADRRLAELTERLRAAAGADGTVERRRARLAALVEAATAVREVRGAVALAREQVEALAVRVEKLAGAAGVVDAPPPVLGANGIDYAVLRVYGQAVDAASRSAAQQSEIEAALVAADRARAHAETVLAEPDIRAAADQPPGDLAGLESAVAQAQTLLERAVAAHSEAARRVEQLEELCSQLWAAVDRIAPLQRTHDELARLAEVVAGRGENNRRMSLRSYVLAARLEEVAVAASSRLRLMCGGRYEFVHSDAAGRHGRRGGLGLDIRDDYTGAVRPAKTLSGGETFMASLALALGLADVVAAESGGLVLDTLFIDEGFGSLDADTLDAVMGVLDELRSGGRVVGVVSHVDEMRQRIPSRLHVVRGRTGSRLETSIGA